MKMSGDDDKPEDQPKVTHKIHIHSSDEELPPELKELQQTTRRLIEKYVGGEVPHIMSVIAHRQPTGAGCNVMFDLFRSASNPNDVAELYAAVICNIVNSLNLISAKFSDDGEKNPQAARVAMMNLVTAKIAQQMDQGISEVWGQVVKQAAPDPEVVKKQKEDEEFLKEESFAMQRALLSLKDGVASWAECRYDDVIDASMEKVKARFPDKKYLVTELRGKIISVRSYSAPEVAANKISRLYWKFKEDAFK